MIPIQIKEKYLCFPVKREAPEKLVTLFPAKEKEKKLREFQIPWPGEGEAADYWAAVPVQEWLGQELLLCGDMPDARLAMARQQGERPAPADALRPRIHFAPENGWMNDPNGLIRHGGLALLYYQFNPFQVAWGPMHWGHAVSRDLLHWETRDIALFPDEQGTMFSGCAWRDGQGLAGRGKDALLFFYTCAGGTEAPWSRDGTHTQRLAWSTDGGETLRKEEGVLLPALTGENRDPKVFFHEESGAYGMVLYLEKNDFALFRSTDLRHWHETQRLTLPGARECPDLFCLPVEGCGERKWVFWSADGFYFVGSYDGYRFTPEQERRQAYANRIPYAAQTFACEPDRTLSMAWLRLPNRGRCFTGVMSLPAELSLCRRGGAYVLRFSCCRELEAALRPLPEASPAPEGPWVLDARVPAQAGQCTLEFPGGPLRLNLETGRGTLGQTEFRFPAGAGLSFRLVADYTVLEFFGDGGAVYAAEENRCDHLAGAVSLTGAQGGALPFRLAAAEAESNV